MVKWLRFANRDLDQTERDKRREAADKQARGPHTEPEAGTEAARKRAGWGLQGATRRIRRAGLTRAGYRETKPHKP